MKSESESPEEGAPISPVEMLEKAFAHALEQSAFLFHEKPEPEEVHFNEPLYQQVSVSFDGPRHGAIEAIAPDSFGAVIAANTLGEEPELVQPDLANDSFKELLNVTCGEFLNLLSGSTAVYKIGIPSLSTITPAQMEEILNSPDAAPFVVDDISGLLCVKLQD